MQNLPEIDTVCWYVMRVAYKRVMELKRYLDERRVESFLPMRYEYVTAQGRKVRKLVPAIYNLVFVRASRQQVHEIKEATSQFARYYMHREDGRPCVTVVPDVQMENFIRVAGTFDDQLLYFSDQELDLTKGDKVRILAGPFAGAVGVYIRLKGTRARRVVVSIEGVMAVATTTVPPSQVERIR